MPRSRQRNQIIVIGMILFVISGFFWVESGRSYNNYVVKIGDVNLVTEMEDFSFDFQITPYYDPISSGHHGYTKHSWSDASPFGKFEVVKLIGKPNRRNAYYSQIILPVCLLTLLSLVSVGAMIFRLHQLRRRSGYKEIEFV